MPHQIKPMLATLTKKPFDAPGWFFEIKWDGYRAIAEVAQEMPLIYSRNGLSLNQAFSPIVDSLRELRFEAVLDGEIVVLDDRGYPNFQMLQDYPKSGKGHLIYYVFDLLYFEGRVIMNLPLIRRKELLKKILPSDVKIKYSEHVEREGVLFFQAAKEKGLEGMVAKEAQSLYTPGRRSRQWLKVKTHVTQEGVIGGFTEPRGRRQYLGALILGMFEQGELVYIGHIGTGFDTEMLRTLREKLEPLIQETCPFKVKPETNAPVTWVRPELVCEVNFQEWTDSGIMRHPVFSRLREDREAGDVVREEGI